jgi:serine/threonine-protein kinase
MAVVHRARDGRHARDVAVKLMLPAVSNAVGTERFLREIETAARLQHPHIVPVFDSGSVDGQLFFVMPLIEGESLRGRLQRERQLEPGEAVRIVREIADALDYAHSQGVVHRDVKPENILMSRGHALLADFGIARVASTEDQVTLAVTGAGTILGTPSYMSPEAASGEADAGAASDVYSLGCLLFELLAGQPPFTGATSQALLVKRLTSDAPRIRSLRTDVSAPIDEAIARALDRDPARRPTALQFSEALADRPTARQTPVPPPAGDRSIVVLPFDNLSPDPNDAYLASGLTEEVIADLSRVTALRVIARSSAMAAAQKTRDLKEVSRLLDVRYLVEGSVRRAGNQLRVTAQLIDGTTDAHLWADKYGGTMDDVFEVQERISRAIVQELRARLSAEEHASLKGPTTDPETYELYLRARHLLGQSLLRMPAAMPLLEEVMRRDPDFVPAYCVAGAPLVLAAVMNFIHAKSAWARIQELAERALSIDARSGPAHELLAAVALYRDWNWSEARRLYERARELEPGVGFNRFLYAFFLMFSGDVAGGIREAREGRRLDPLDAVGMITESAMLSWAGDFDAGFAVGQRLIEMDAQFPEGYHLAAYALLGKGDFATAERYLRKCVDLSQRAPWPTAKLGRALVGLGRLDEARALASELEHRALTERTMSGPAIATVYLHLGDREAFYRWMERGIEDRDAFALSVNREFLWEPAREDDRFRALVRRVGLEPR